MARRKIAGYRAILTGASSGVGRELAKALAGAQVDLVLIARREDRLVELKRELSQYPARIEIVVGDITQNATRQQALSIAQTSFGGLDLLINNAGITGLGRFDQADAQRLREIMEVNFFGPAELIRESLPLLKGSGKRPAIVNVGSVLGHRAVPLKSEYCASKFAMHGFSDALRAELSEDGIDLILISPSTINSELFDTAISDTSGRKWNAARGTSPEKVAAKIVRAIKSGRHEIIISLGGKLLVWLDRFCPPLMNRLIARFG
jgi:short-subunit dehydrogenase